VPSVPLARIRPRALVAIYRDCYAVCVDEQQPVPLPKSVPVADPVSPRASDADRDRTAGILREALAEGRLDPGEHAERIDAVYRAKTLAELDPLVRDLPAGGASGWVAAPGPSAASPSVPSSSFPSVTPSGRPAGALPEGDNLVAVFGGAVRRGHWRVRPRTNAFALFGGVQIDLTEAVFEQQEVVVNAAVMFGGLEIRVPENVTLRCTGAGIFGGFDVASYESPDPQAPVVVVSGFALFGGVDAKARRGKRLKNLRSSRT
jgi:hypothetical protein